MTRRSWTNHSSVKLNCEYCHFSFTLCQGLKKETKNPSIICERKEGFDTFIQTTALQLTSGKWNKYIYERSAFLLLSILTFLRLRVQHRAVLHGVVPKPISSRWSRIKRLPHTHTGKQHALSQPLSIIPPKCWGQSFKAGQTTLTFVIQLTHSLLNKVCSISSKTIMSVLSLSALPLCTYSVYEAQHT